VLPRWRDVQVAAVDTAEVEGWVAELVQSGLSPSRTRQAYVVLRGVLDTAVKSRRLAVNPAQRVELPRAAERPRRYLTMAQLEELADAAGEYGLLVRVLGYCGLRWGEATALTVAKADLLRSRLVVDCALSDIAGVVTVGTTKSHKSREVPVSRFLRDALAEHIAGKGHGDLIFPAPRGGFMRNGNFRRGYFNRSAKQVGLEGLIPHELRHTAASLAIQSGANVKVVQTMMGHASATMTWDLYGHLYDGDLDTVAERLDVARATFLRTKCGQSADSGAEVVELEAVR
jgi:integrase